jgi:hypothetical protein
MNDKKNKTKQQKNYQNTLESLKDIPNDTARSLKEDLVQKMPQDALNQIFGGPVRKSFSGEMTAGESLEINEVYSGKREKEEKLKTQLSYERHLRQEEQQLITKKSNELRMQLKVLMEEVITLSENTQELSEEVHIAAQQAPVEPGLYHVVFFEKLVKFIKSFRQRVKEANTWMHAANERASKKGYWAKYKKYGAKFLLSGEHYLTRSAG